MSFWNSVRKWLQIHRKNLIYRFSFFVYIFFSRIKWKYNFFFCIYFKNIVALNAIYFVPRAPFVATWITTDWRMPIKRTSYWIKTQFLPFAASLRTRTNKKKEKKKHINFSQLFRQCIGLKKKLKQKKKKNTFERFARCCGYSGYRCADGTRQTMEWWDITQE